MYDQRDLLLLARGGGAKEEVDMIRVSHENKDFSVPARKVTKKQQDPRGDTSFGSFNEAHFSEAFDSLLLQAVPSREIVDTIDCLVINSSAS